MLWVTLTNYEISFLMSFDSQQSSCRMSSVAAHSFLSVPLSPGEGRELREQHEGGDGGTCITYLLCVT